MAKRPNSRGSPGGAAAPPAGRGFDARPLLALALLTVVVVVVYHGSLDGPFIFDDIPAIVENPDIRSLGAALRESPQLDTATAAGRPLLRVLLFANFAIGGLDVRSYHVVNLLLHVVAAFALFALLRRLLQSPAMNAETGAAANGLALSVALLWSVHPLQTESVTYVVQRTEVLGALFYLATLYCVSRCAGASGGAAAAWAVAAVGSCMLGMAAKETLASAPLLALAMDRVFYARSWPELWRARRRLYIGLASSWVVLAILVAAASGRQRTVGFDLGMAWWQYALTQPYYVCRYLLLTLWPGPLTLDYGRHLAATPGEVIPYLVIVTAFIGATTWTLLRRPALGFCGLWLFVILAPTSSIVPIVTQTGAEHRMYLPLAGVVAALVVVPYVRLVRRGQSTGRLRLAGVALVAVATVALGARTMARNEDYGSAVSIWESAIAHWPSNPRAHLSLGLAVAERGNPAEAIRHFQRAVALQPGYVDAEVELATALARTGKREEAIERLEALLQQRPDLGEAHHNLGTMLLLEGRAGEAIPRFEKAMELRPADVATQLALADALVQGARPSDAIPRLESVLRLAPDSMPARAALAGVLAAAGRSREAAAHYEEALRRSPAQAELLNNLAWIRATDPDPDVRDPDEAIRLAARAVALAGGASASYLDTLAAAEAAAGRFSEAVASAERALSLARAEGQEALADQIALHLARYRAGQVHAPE